MPGLATWANVIGDEPALILLDELPPHFVALAGRQAGTQSTEVDRLALGLANLMNAILSNKLPSCCLVISDLAGSWADGSARIQQAINNANSEVSRATMDIVPVRLDSIELYGILQCKLFETLPDKDSVERRKDIIGSRRPRRAEFERNLKAIANNATGMSSALTRGAAREGELLPGLLRCGHRGRKLHVHYGGKLGRYDCYGARMNHGTARCISVSGLSMDAAIAEEVLSVLKPLGMEAAIKAIKAQSSETTAAERQLELSLQQARYGAAHARRQYDAVDPANRLVAGELERRWNEALQAVAKLDGDIAARRG